MNTKSISTVDFIRNFGRYHDEAQRKPLTLTKHGRASLVVVSADMFARLTENADPRRAYYAGEAPEEITNMFLAGLERREAEYRDGKDD